MLTLISPFLMKTRVFSNKTVSEHSIEVSIIQMILLKELCHKILSFFVLFSENYLIQLIKGKPLLPLCSMVGCATNATQCTVYNGEEMMNSVPIGNHTQAYFKSIFASDKTFLSINCDKTQIPCCFSKHSK